MQKFHKLNVWVKSIDFIANIYKTTQTYPKHEFYGLVNQIRRAAVSIALNIAEGSGSGSDNEFARSMKS